MDRDDLLKQLLNNPAAAPILLTNPLSNADADFIVVQLKQEADRHWYIDPNCSVAYADVIVRIGQMHGDAKQIGLGLMARGDAIKLLGRMQEAWETLDNAGTVFHNAGDEIGWARTRIGRLYISTQVNRVDEALADAARARTIFTRHGDADKLLRLEINLVTIYNFLGEHRRALEQYQTALAAAEAMGAAGKDYLPTILMNLGYAYNYLGDFRHALAYYERARVLLIDSEQSSGAALAELNMASIAVAQGYYRRALRVLHNVEERTGEQFPKETALAHQYMIECYLALNRFAEASALARQEVANYKRQGASYDVACTLIFLAQAEAELGDYPAAQAALDEAEPLLVSLGAVTWTAQTALRRGQIALQQGDSTAAHHQAEIAMRGFDNRLLSYAEALLLNGLAAFNGGESAEAEQSAQMILEIARQGGVPALRYNAHLLLGRIAEARGRSHRALRHYTAADATLQRVQRGLTITLRPGFLADKGDAMRALMRLYLQERRVERAFETLERAKSQTVLSYLGNREQLHWAENDPHSQRLIAELNQLREEHHWFYRVAHHTGEQDSQITPQQAVVEMSTRERRMRSITEQLYLRSSDSYHAYAPVPSQEDIRASLTPGVMLIEYYNDGTNVWAFTLDEDGLQVCGLPITVATLDGLIDKFRRYIDRALRAHADVMPQLTRATQQTAQQLYNALLKPIEQRLTSCQQLVMIPYGALHYLPFHLLHDGRDYLIEDYEVVVLPAASLVKRHGSPRTGGALVLSHSQGGALPQTLIEGGVVQSCFGGTLLSEEQANRDALLRPPQQILHIAAHGEHRIDQPDFSYIQLHDGHLLSDDVMQCDLSYELVTLSACETGLARVAPGDELIGLGRGFLYAGAGALLTSLWRVNDQTAIQLMQAFYNALCTGESKAAALNQAQNAILHRQPDLHPAFWGAFQLVGDPRPLSTSNKLFEGETQHVRFAI